MTGPWWILALALLGAYLVGALPFGVLIARTGGVDIRRHGSGNVGATNVFRVMGPAPGLLCFALDFAKGFVPVILVGIFAGGVFRPATVAWLAVGVACVAVLGHSKSVFLGFTGGKSVATGAGALMALSPQAGALAVGLWLVVLLVARYVSLASIAAALSLPLWMWVVHAPVATFAFGGLIALYVPLRHRSNLARLRAGTEPKIKLRGRH